MCFLIIYIFQSSNIAEAAYNSLWYNQSIKSRKIMLYTLLRCQRVVISVPGLLRTSTFQHYASVREYHAIVYSQSLIIYNVIHGITKKVLAMQNINQRNKNKVFLYKIIYVYTHMYIHICIWFYTKITYKINILISLITSTVFTIIIYYQFTFDIIPE